MRTPFLFYRKTRFFFAGIFLYILVQGCEHSLIIEPEVKVFPVVQENDSIYFKAHTNTGIFKGDICGIQLLKGIGNSWNTNNITNHVVELSRHTDTFSIVIPNIFVEKEQIEYRAFISSDKKAFYSKSKSFKAMKRNLYIDDFTPKELGSGDALMIYGRGFGTDISEVILKAGKVTLNLKDISENRILAEVPEYSEGEHCPLSIEKKNVSSFSSDSISLKGVMIKSVQTEYKNGYCYITINGKGFSKVPWRNTLLLRYYASYTPQIISTNENQIRAMIAYNFCYSGLYTLTLTVENMSTKYRGIKLPTLWNQEEDIPNNYMYYSGIFSLNDYLYFCTGETKTGGGTNVHSKVYSYNTKTSRWKEHQNFPGGERYFASAFSYNGQGYLLCGAKPHNPNYSDFWRYNPNSESWKKLNDFPGGAQFSMATTVANDKAYVGLGYKYNKIWEYDIINNNWKVLPDFPTIPKTAKIVVIKEDLFVFAYEYDGQTSRNCCYKYNFSEERWVFVSNLNNKVLSSFIHNETCYVFMSVKDGMNNSYDLILYKFLPESGELSEPLIMYPSRNRTFYGYTDIYYNNRFYYGGGIISSHFNRELWNLNLSDLQDEITD